MPPTSKRPRRPDQSGPHRTQYDKAKKMIFATQTVCGICGRPVDFSLKYPHPMSPCIDHIMPVSKGGSPDDIDNLQLAHWKCNRAKGDKLPEKKNINNDPAENEVASNGVLPLSYDWTEHRS